MSERTSQKGPIKYTLKKSDEKAVRSVKMGSKYDPLIDEFIASDMTLAEVEVEDIKRTTVRTALQKRLTTRKIDTVVSLTSAGIVYLEKVKPKVEPSGE